MSTQSVEQNEALFRQVGPGTNPIRFDPSRVPPLDSVVFLPTGKDTDGLSLIRNRFRAPIWSAFRPERPDIRFRIAKLVASHLTGLASKVGFTELRIEPTPDSLDEQYGEPWAHCVVREINRTDYDADKQKRRMIKDWAQAVADSVELGAISDPFPEPKDSDHYRP